MVNPADVSFRDGLVPAVVVDARDGAILTLAYMNEESLRRTIQSGETWFWSRSRNELWHKGETSGNRQRLVDIALDCDGDALVVTVIPDGPSCHNGARSCFDGAAAATMERLMAVLADRHTTRPNGSYSASLFNAGTDRILKKLGEEATEVILAAKGEGRERLIDEVSDLLFHLCVLMVDQKLEWTDAMDELRRRS